MLSLGCERLPTPLKKKKKKKGSGSLPSPRSGYATTITVFFFAHLLILQYPHHHQNLISSYLYYSGPVQKISSQSVHNFLSNVVHRQTNRQTDRQTDKLTNATKNITSFAKEVTIGTYAKLNVSQSTSTDDILRFLTKYKYIIKSDMTKQFFQLPMKKSSIKYLGILTPYKGVRVYTRAAMGMPGSTEHLDELMSRVLGDLMEQGIVKKSRTICTQVETLSPSFYITGNKSFMHLSGTTYVSLLPKLSYALSRLRSLDGYGQPVRFDPPLTR